MVVRTVLAKYSINITRQSPRGTAMPIVQFLHCVWSAEHIRKCFYKFYISKENESELMYFGPVFPLSSIRLQYPTVYHTIHS